MTAGGERLPTRNDSLGDGGLILPGVDEQYRLLGTSASRFSGGASSPHHC